jgi:hypothetical protein
MSNPISRRHLKVRRMRPLRGERGRGGRARLLSITRRLQRRAKETS